MDNLIKISDLTIDEIQALINLAEDFQSEKATSTSFGKHLAMMLFESSTSTHFSFEMAANKLGVHLYNFDTTKSAFTKGESMKDAIENLYQIGINGVVIRHGESGFIEKTISEISCPMKFINGGEGKKSHPTQALIDFYTLKKHFGSIDDKKIAIIGDVRHSRVAHSDVCLFNQFGADVWFCAPKYFKDETNDITYTDDLAEALDGADAAIFLRVQKERLEDRIPIFDYVHDYGLTMKKLEKYATKDILIMHPSPVNRDIEISSEVLDSEYGKTILEQAHNSVFVRMAVIDFILGKNN